MKSASLLVLLMTGCAAAAPKPAPAAETASARPTPNARATTPTPRATPPAEADAGSDAGIPVVRVLAFRRVLDVPVHSIALGAPPRVALLGEDAWLDGGKGLVRMPAVRRGTEHLRIYFGRDDAPRVMGFEQGAGGEQSIYLRWREGAWQRAASEIGRLGGAGGALYGVLGTLDPEVVCKPGEVCIIKRRTGWTTIPAPPGRPEVSLSGATAWALGPGTLHRLDPDGWHSLGDALPFKHASSVWALAADELWVAEREPSKLHHSRGPSWTELASPIAGPRALWASSASDLWLVGDGGAAHFDGSRWSRVEGPTGPLEVVTGRGPDEVWIAGGSGVWQGTRK